jgi:hypothetical protein
MDLIDSYKIFYSITTEYTFFSSIFGTFSKIYYILEYKASLKNTRKLK